MLERRPRRSELQRDEQAGNQLALTKIWSFYREELGALGSFLSTRRRLRKYFFSEGGPEPPGAPAAFLPFGFGARCFLPPSYPADLLRACGTSVSPLPFG